MRYYQYDTPEILYDGGYDPYDQVSGLGQFGFPGGGGDAGIGKTFSQLAPAALSFFGQQQVVRAGAKGLKYQAEIMRAQAAARASEMQTGLVHAERARILAEASRSKGRVLLAGGLGTAALVLVGLSIYWKRK